MSFARECLPFVLPPALAALVAASFGYVAVAVCLGVLAFLVLLFFRVPTVRIVPDSRYVLAPAYGRVTAVDEIVDPAVGNEPVQRIVTFLSVFDVHIQRCPIDGRVEMRRLTNGRKVAAFRADADAVNSSELSVLRTQAGSRVAVRQIVGLVARRIVCYLREGETIDRGQPLGLIKFGSRVDLLVPGSWEILVSPGDRLRAGETAVALPVEGDSDD